MSDKYMYPCQLAVAKKAETVIVPLSAPLCVGLPDPVRNSNVYQVRFYCPITGRHCTYHYSQGTEPEVVNCIAMGTVCKECVYKQRIEEEENELGKYKR